MKHIKKKAIELIIPEAAKLFDNNPLDINEKPDFNQVLVLQSENEEKVSHFFVKKGKDHFFYPIVPLTLVNFDFAYQLNIQRKDYEKKALRSFNNFKMSDGVDLHHFYIYYGYASNCVISLFTALESFVNYLIPDDYIFKKEIKGKRIELYNKEQIQRWLTTDEKIKDVLFSITGKNFFQKQTEHTSRIDNLKNLRDELIHVKADANLENQKSIIKKLIDFKYNETLESVSKFINFYKPNFIEECNCGVEF